MFLSRRGMLSLCTLALCPEAFDMYVYHCDMRYFSIGEGRHICIVRRLCLRFSVGPLFIPPILSLLLIPERRHLANGPFLRASA